MAAIFCLFSVTLCKLAGHDVSNSLSNNNNNYNNINNQDNGASVISLSAPNVITVPRVYTSPCPESFRYTYNGREWFGLVAIPSLPKGIPMRIRIIFTVGIRLPPVSVNIK
jgi:hypothetical protein